MCGCLSDCPALPCPAIPCQRQARDWALQWWHCSLCPAHGSHGRHEMEHCSGALVALLCPWQPWQALGGALQWWHWFDICTSQMAPRRSNDHCFSSPPAEAMIKARILPLQLQQWSRRAYFPSSWSNDQGAHTSLPAEAMVKARILPIQLNWRFSAEERLFAVKIKSAYTSLD